MKSNSSIKTVVAVGIGAALFFVLGRFVAIPSPVPRIEPKPLLSVERLDDCCPVPAFK